MRSRLALLIVLAAAGASAAPTVTLSFVATSDIHGHVGSERAELVLDGRPGPWPRARGGLSPVTVEVERGGLALLGGYLANLRRERPGRVVLLDGGDMLQGTLVSNLGEGRAVVRAMNALGYAAAAVGNHEFDFGPIGPRSTPKDPGDDPRGALAARAGEARFPWLTANVVDGKGRPAGASNVHAWTTLVVDGIKVGVVGGTSEDLPRTTIRPNLVGLTTLPLAPAIARAAAEARAAGATVVVAVVHAGGECVRFDDPDDPGACQADSEVAQLARALPRGAVDAIFAGHTHQGMAHRVAGIPVLQAFAEARAFSRLDLVVDRATGRPVPGGATLFPPTEVCAAVADAIASCDARRARGRALVPARYAGREVAADAAVIAAVAEDVARAEAERSTPVGVTLASPMARAYRAESPLGNFAADVLRAAASADVGLTNGGGLRADLPAGPLRRGDLFQAFPFDNRLAVVTLPGSSLRRLVAANLAGDKGILSLSGITVRSFCQGEKLEVDLTLDGGRPLRDGARYRVGTTDFLALGGDDFHLVTGALPAEAVRIDDGSATLRDLMAAALRRRGPTLRGDDPSLYDPAHPRVTLPAPRPFRCGHNTGALPAPAPPTEPSGPHPQRALPARHG